MNRKLDAERAQAIITRALAGERQKDLATEFGVSPSTISVLVSGRSWQDLQRPQNPKKVRRASKLGSQDVREILEKLVNGAKPTTLARDYGVTRQSISNIQKGRTWQDIPRPEPVRPVRRRVWET